MPKSRKFDCWKLNLFCVNTWIHVYLCIDKLPITNCALVCSDEYRNMLPIKYAILYYYERVLWVYFYFLVKLWMCGKGATVTNGMDLGDLKVL